MKKRKRMAAMLAVCMLFSFVAGCGSDKEDSKESLQTKGEGDSGFVYVAENLENHLEGAGYTLCLLKNQVVYTNYIYENGMSKIELVCAPIEEDRVGTATKTLLEVDGNGSLDTVFTDGENTIYALAAVSNQEPDWDDPDFSYDQYARNHKFYLHKLTAEGEELSEQEITSELKEFLDAGQYYGVKGVVLSDGGICLYSNENILFFNADGKKCGSYRGDGYINSVAAGRDEKLYMVINGMDNPGLFVMNQSGKNPTSLVKGFVNGVFLGKDDSIYLYDSVGIKKLLEDGNTEKLFDWTDANIVGNYVQLVAPLDENRIFVTQQDWSSNEFTTSILKKMEAGKVQQKTKTVLTLGMLYNDRSILADAVAFNKSSDKYRVKVKNYIDDTAEWTDHTFSDALTQLQNDIVVGDGKLDMVLTDPSYMDTLIDKGAVEDLFPYLEASSSVHKEDYIEKALEACTKNGVLVTLPSTFYLRVVSVKKELMPQAKGWNLAEILDFAEAHPKSDLTTCATKDAVMNFLMTMTAGEFLNMEEGTSHFDHPLFQRMLNYCSKYPDEINLNNLPGKSPVEMIQDDDFLLMDPYLGDFNDVQYHKALYGDSELNYIGYPNEKGNKGIRLSCGNGYSMLTTSREKDGVFAFMEYVASKPHESDSMYSFPAKKSDFESVRKKATTVEYLTDDNGEFILDENGEKININAVHMRIADENGWSYTYRGVTEEEANLVEELIALATPADESIDQDIYNIIFEEAQPFFKGQKSVEEVCSIMNNRISLLLKEKM